MRKFSHHKVAPKICLIAIYSVKLMVFMHMKSFVKCVQYSTSSLIWALLIGTITILNTPNIDTNCRLLFKMYINYSNYTVNNLSTIDTKAILITVLGINTFLSLLHKMSELHHSLWTYHNLLCLWISFTCEQSTFRVTTTHLLLHSTGTT